jgi:type III secretion protein U
MNDETSEEKTLPASDKKLRDARRKGQVSQSKDLIGGFTLLLMLMYLPFAAPSLGARLSEFLDIISRTVDLPFAEAANRSMRLVLESLLLISFPPIVIVVVGTVVSGVISTYGPVFSFETVQPKFEHINPVDGLKRIFALRNIVEFAKATAKVMILGTAFFLIMRGAIGPLFQTPACGQSCIVGAALETAKPLAVTAAVAFLIIGFIDLLIQRRLFLRDMKMTRTESKRELKDLEGDPLIRGERRRIRQQFAGGSVRLGIKNAVIVIMHGDQVVGLRYKPGDTPVPTVVSKAVGEPGKAMLEEARQLGLPIIDDEAFVTALRKRHGVGETISTDLFQAAAQALVNAGFT